MQGRCLAVDISDLMAEFFRFSVSFPDLNIFPSCSCTFKFVSSHDWHMIGTFGTLRIELKMKHIEAIKIVLTGVDFETRTTLEEFHEMLAESGYVCARS